MASSINAPRFVVFKCHGGWAYLVDGEKGLLRSGLPRKKKADVLDIIKAEFPQAVEDKGILPELVADLCRYYEGENVPLKAKLDLSAQPPFSAKVYKALRGVKRGRCVTYGELAEKAGSAGAARGVGGAMRRNPFPPIVPCHRVLGSDGKLTGFTSEGGVELKRRMLEAEGYDVSRLR